MAEPATAIDHAMDALTLVLAAFDLNQTGGCVEDGSDLTSADSRRDALLLRARDKIVATCEAIDQSTRREVAHG